MESIQENTQESQQTAETSSDIDLQAEIEQFKDDEINRLKQEITDKDAEIDNLRNRLNAASEEIDELNDEIDELNDEIDELSERRETEEESAEIVEPEIEVLPNGTEVYPLPLIIKAGEEELERMQVGETKTIGKTRNHKGALCTYVVTRNENGSHSAELK